MNSKVVLGSKAAHRKSYRVVLSVVLSSDAVASEDALGDVVLMVVVVLLLLSTVAMALCVQGSEGLEQIESPLTVIKTTASTGHNPFFCT